MLSHPFRKGNSLLFAATTAAALLAPAPEIPAAESAECRALDASFVAPPKDVRTAVYWYWINDNISKEGVIADLHAMKRAGITRAYIGHIGAQGGPHGKIKLFSPEWWEVMRVALKTATELEIEIGLFNSPGWSQSGGPWVKPEQAMRYLAASETHVTGPKDFVEKLPAPAKNFQDVKVLAFPAQPGNRASLFLAEGAKLVHSDNIKPPSNGALVPVKIPRGGPAYFGVKLPAAAAARSLFLQFEGSVSAHCEVQARENGEFRTIRAFDISRVNFNPNVGFNPRAPVVISFPEVKSDEFRLVFTRVGGDATLARLSLTPTPIVERFPEKTLAKMIQHPTLSWGDYLWESQTGDTAAALKPDDVRDISRHLAADGTLSWQVPAGEWVILRTGMTPTGTRNSPSSPQGIGLEVDKMSRTHTTSHFDAFLGEIIRRVPAAERKSFKVAVLDSYETGGQNFTDGFLEQFRGRYGYDPLPFLPAYHGHTVGSPDLSDRFLWDVRRLVADKVAYDYVGGLRAASNKHGVTTWLENYGHWGFPAEFLQYGGQSDEIGGEFWSEGNLGSIENRCASSCAHIYGKKRVWAESFTSGGDEFRRHPARLKRRGDWAFTEGVNSSLLHVYIQQYDNDDYPGVTAWFGAEFNRKNSWFPHIDLFTLYLRRCNFMLQQGRHSADVAYFIGEDTPKMTGIREPALPKGYNYDYINAEVILRDLAVKDGRLVLPHGMTYRVLVLPPQDTMRPELLRKIEQLVADGATVLGAPPSRSPSLQNYPAADAEVRALAAKLWSAAPARHRLYGKGQIFTGVRLEDVFEHLGLSPEFAVEPAAPVLHTRRIAADADIFFITNQSERRVQITPHFRVTGKQPEHWNPVTGERRKLPAYTQDARATAVPLQLEPSESAFVVFREKVGKPVAGTGAAGLAANFPQGEVLAKAAAPWEVRFESDPVKRGPAEPVVFAALQDWSKHPDSRIRHFSGVARYTTTLHLGELPKDKKLRLDLGKVALLAKVKINGKNAGGAWTPPYSLEITPFVKQGANTLEIEVANGWANRIIGDSALPAEQRKIKRTWRANTPLETAGLLGPVKVLQY